MLISRIIIYFTIFLLYTTKSIISLQCYQCNSYTDNECNSGSISKERPKLCPPHLQASCKTIIQDAPFIYSHNATNKPATRVYRDCSGIPVETSQCMDRVGTEKVKLRYCICSNDACNHAIAYNHNEMKLFLFATLFNILFYSYSIQ
ncbi:unnamed protein product [Heterobilharzia americana]|nr:unnamed protein product [Heterobilharzia americana]CAH8626119.1 unnamed protein product [Heterobilharzia americana]